MEACFVFGLTCAERMMGNYHEFYRITKWGNPERLRSILDFLWQQKLGISDSTTLNELITECTSLMPDTEDFSTILVSSALDVATVISLLLQYVLVPDRTLVCDIASLSIDTVDMYVQELLDIEPNDPELEKKILTSKLMQKELQNQKEVVHALQLEESLELAMDSYVKAWRAHTSSLGFT